MSSIFQLADYIIGRYSKYPGGITPMKLQKLLYYLKAWGLVAEVPVVSESFAKWAYGPVNHELYTKYKNFGASKIPSSLSSTNKIDHKEFVDFVLESYAPFSALTLSALTHKEKPWLETEENKTISETLMKSYYKKQHFAKNFPLNPDSSYFPVLTDMYYSFIMDMDQDKVKPPVYASFADYKEKTKKVQTEIEKAFVTFLKEHPSI